MRIRHNGPRSGAIDIEPYADKYLEHNERCDPLHSTGRASKAVKHDHQQMEPENVYTSIFS